MGMPLGQAPLGQASLSRTKPSPGTCPLYLGQAAPPTALGFVQKPASLALLRSTFEVQYTGRPLCSLCLFGIIA